VLRILRRLGGLPALLAAPGRLVPVRLADALYDRFAARRRRLPSPAGGCPRPPESWRGRLLP
jgi:predicted DCC family thiol-disulfide oxidoreductase YuxK